MNAKTSPLEQSHTIGFVGGLLDLGDGYGLRGGFNRKDQTKESSQKERRGAAGVGLAGVRYRRHIAPKDICRLYALSSQLALVHRLAVAKISSLGRDEYLICPACFGGSLARLAAQSSKRPARPSDRSFGCPARRLGLYMSTARARTPSPFPLCRNQPPPPPRSTPACRLPTLFPTQ